MPRTYLTDFVTKYSLAYLWIFFSSNYFNMSPLYLKYSLILILSIRSDQDFFFSKMIQIGFLKEDIVTVIRHYAYFYFLPLFTPSMT